MSSQIKSHVPRRTHPQLTAQKKRELAEAAERIDREEKDRLMAWARQGKQRLEARQGVLAMLRAERQRQGLSLAEVDERCGIGRSNLSRLENSPDANPTLDTLQRYAAALGKRIDVSLRDLAT